MLSQLPVGPENYSKICHHLGAHAEAPVGHQAPGFFICFAPLWVFPSAPKSDNHQDKAIMKKSSSSEEEATVLPVFAFSPSPGKSKTHNNSALN